MIDIHCYLNEEWATFTNLKTCLLNQISIISNK